MNFKSLHVLKVICNNYVNVYSTTFYIMILNRKSDFPCFQKESLSLKNFLKEIKIALKTMSLYFGTVLFSLFFPSAFLQILTEKPTSTFKTFIFKSFLNFNQHICFLQGLSENSITIRTWIQNLKNTKQICRKGKNRWRKEKKKALTKCRFFLLLLYHGKQVFTFPTAQRKGFRTDPKHILVLLESF